MYTAVESDCTYSCRIGLSTAANPGRLGRVTAVPGTAVLLNHRHSTSQFISAVLSANAEVRVVDTALNNVSTESNQKHTFLTTR